MKSEMPQSPKQTKPKGDLWTKADMEGAIAYPMPCVPAAKPRSQEQATPPAKKKKHPAKK